MIYSTRITGHRGVMIVNMLFLLLNVAILMFGLGHRSSEPQLFGRYSYEYAFLLLGLGIIFLFQVWLLCCPVKLIVRAAENIYLFLIATLLVLGITEYLLRFVNPWGMDFFHNLPYHMQGMLDHPELGYVHPKSVIYRLGDNTVQLNSKGLRDREISPGKPVDEKRILVLGDSVAFGWGVDQGETFSDRMEPLLKDLTNDHWEVINAGVNGYNTQQEATYLRLEGLHFEPDIVILLYVFNDIEPVFDPNVTTWRRYPTWPASLPEALDRVRRLSYLFQITKLFLRMRERAEAQLLENGATGKTQSAFTQQAGWQESKSALQDIAQMLRERNVPFLVATESGYNKTMMKELGMVGISITTLNPVWEGIPPDRANVSRIDPHPSAEIHARMAVRLVQELKERGWVEEASEAPSK